MITYYLTHKETIVILLNSCGKYISYSFKFFEKKIQHFLFQQFPLDSKILHPSLPYNDRASVNPKTVTCNRRGPRTSFPREILSQATEPVVIESKCPAVRVLYTYLGLARATARPRAYLASPRAYRRPRRSWLAFRI